MLVSIVINNYNYGRFLGEAIESALAQTYPATEVIVVDDGSKDHSREVIAGYSDRILPVLKSNGGQGSAFNAGFTASRGEIVLFLDSDDALYPHAVERIVAQWNARYAKVHFPLTRINARGEQIGFEPGRGQKLPAGEVWPDFLRDGHYVTPATSGNAYARAALAAILPTPEPPYIHSADAYLNTRIVFHGPLGVIAEPLGIYRVHGSNDSLGNVLSADVARVRHLMAREPHNDAGFCAELDRLGISADREARYRYYHRLKLRVLSWKLDRANHPKRGDTAGSLLRKAVSVVTTTRGMDLRERLLQALWFAFVFGLPVRAVAWLLAHGGALKRLLKPAPAKAQPSLATLPSRA